MNNPLKINSKAINKAEIARKIGYSREYVRLLLRGDRKNQNALDKVYREIRKQLKAA